VGGVLMKAFSIALSGKPGPVYVEIPLDIVNSDVGHAAKQQYNIEMPLASDEEVAEVADLLAEAEYPVILVGRGVRIANAEKLVIKLAELLNSPIVTTVMAKDVIPSCCW
jgi:acetolactate synthase-1/2/3 large subunit